MATFESSFPISNVILSFPRERLDLLLVELIKVDIASKCLNNDATEDTISVKSLKYHVHFGIHGVSYKCIIQEANDTEGVSEDGNIIVIKKLHYDNGLDNLEKKFEFIATGDKHEASVVSINGQGKRRNNKRRYKPRIVSPEGESAKAALNTDEAKF